MRYRKRNNLKNPFNTVIRWNIHFMIYRNYFDKSKSFISLNRTYLYYIFWQFKYIKITKCQKLKSGKFFKMVIIVCPCIFSDWFKTRYPPSLSPISRACARAYAFIYTQTITSLQAFRLHSGHPSFSDQMDKIPWFLCFLTCQVVIV